MSPPTLRRLPGRSGTEHVKFSLSPQAALDSVTEIVEIAGEPYW